MSSYLRLRASRLWGAALIVLMLLTAFAITYGYGGSSTSLPHLFYIPIIVGAFTYPRWGGFVVGLVAGLLCGPLMPSVTDLSIAQTFENWLLRLLFFATIGLLTGTLAHSLHNRLKALRTLNAETVLAFVRAIDAKDPYTADHSVRVAQYAVAIAEHMGLSAQDTERVKWAALLHDVGKIAIPGEILRKTGRLTDQEWEMVKTHPDRAVEILKGIESFRPYLAGIRQHHERMDGGGYPDGATADDICLDARIIAVADAFESITASRPYHDAQDCTEALKRIQSCAGSQFDPLVVQALERALKETPGRFCADGQIR